MVTTTNVMYSACWPYKQATETPVTGFTSLCSWHTLYEHSRVHSQMPLAGKWADIESNCCIYVHVNVTAGVCGRWWHIGPSQYRRRPDVISVQSLAVVCVRVNVYSWCVWTLVAHWAQSISSPTRRDIGPGQYRRQPDVISVQSLAVVCVHMNVYSWFVWTLVAHWAQSISSPT